MDPVAVFSALTGALTLGLNEVRRKEPEELDAVRAALLDLEWRLRLVPGRRRDELAGENMEGQASGKRRFGGSGALPGNSQPDRLLRARPRDVRRRAQEPTTRS